ncbi:phosphatase PAP2 family protein [Novosphingobium sp. YJ-S2-02]|uniref:Phosphatase PAP2 family protein n=1 Tax=Novosphingobium aureum TaxID=2792964 RepID=A0A931MLA4_9SPHN|nr:phosphatase PAP2 family protein [Novosphingobium aureum]MBH0112856.1 phosphatase PAP2 family protein [Novosphingobium aureum]
MTQTRPRPQVLPDDRLPSRPSAPSANARRLYLIAAVLCWAGFVTVAWMVLSGRSTSLDQAGLLFWRDSDLRPIGPPRLLEAVRDVTALGGTLLRNLFALGAVVALVFMHMRREAALLGLTVAGGLVVNAVLKVLVGRDRPEITLHLTEAGGASFPSGHSFGSAVVYMSIALAFSMFARRRKVRATIIASAVAVTFAVAWSRVWLGVHWPTDATAGWLGGMAWTFSAAALLQGSADRAAHYLPEDITPEGSRG